MKLPVLTAAATLLVILGSPQAPVAHNSPQALDSLEERIGRIENGLLPPVSIRGQHRGMRILDRMGHYGVPGLSLAVINNGRLEWARGYGLKETGGDEPVTEETLFQAASISKPVAALAALRLVEEGRLGLDEAVNQRLVSWKVPDNNYTAEQQVTLRHLLSHSSGLTNSIGSYDADEARLPTLVEALDGRSPLKPRPVRVEFVPGSRWEYSGGGYSVLQQLLIDVTGRSFSDLLTESVLRPLGMRHSFFQQPLSAELAGFAATGHGPDGRPHAGRWRVLPEMAAGGLWSTASDLARFGAELQRSLTGASNRVISREMTAMMLSPQVKDWGLGMAVQGEGVSRHFSHTGWNRGYRSILVGFAETGQGAVVMTNGDSRGMELIWEVLRAVANEYGWPAYRTRERVLASVDPGAYAALAGEYEIEPGLRLVVTLENNRLFVRGGPLGRTNAELYPESESRYFLTVADVVFTFVRGASGQVTEMIVQPPEMPRRARRVR
jgi:CubicO group peptidase (beta-lactamase class C family)